ncbi:transient receptor potential cation channel subfamily V member 1 [Platysternon megacephalum]|uniref:Transient receptor potential cation channel subfamily V member 1 n=1 Tax=Platysternon megacephalum TaxID=55544 RepID=A0A4D9EYR8_9SAUR|nr:transient receptor potential cation channel subfamily V member 1 [Platysternon megacephalum]
MFCAGNAAPGQKSDGSYARCVLLLSALSSPGGNVLHRPWASPLAPCLGSSSWQLAHECVWLSPERPGQVRFGKVSQRGGGKQTKGNGDAASKHSAPGPQHGQVICLMPVPRASVDLGAHEWVCMQVIVHVHLCVHLCSRMYVCKCLCLCVGARV